jgi:hypothetical protein
MVVVVVLIVSVIMRMVVVVRMIVIIMGVVIVRMVMIMGMIMIVRVIMGMVVRMIVIARGIVVRDRIAAGPRLELGQQAALVLLEGQVDRPINVPERNGILSRQLGARIEFGSKHDTAAKAAQFTGHLSPRSFQLTRHAMPFAPFDEVPADAEGRRLRKQDLLQSLAILEIADH